MKYMLTAHKQSVKYVLLTRILHNVYVLMMPDMLKPIGCVNITYFRVVCVVVKCSHTCEAWGIPYATTLLQAES